MKRIISLFLSTFLAAASTFAQYHSDEFTNYSDCSVPKPATWKKITRKDLQITDKYLNQYSRGTVLFSQQELQDLYYFYTKVPEGIKAWEDLQNKAVRIISSWDISLGGGFPRYIYKIPATKSLAIVYIFTGNELISQFVRAHLAKIADLPMDFWLHSELRGLDPKCPVGTLETAQLNESLPMAIAAVKKDMSVEELLKIETAWFEMGHKTALNWLKYKKKTNNYLAVIATGAIYSSKYFDDKEGLKVAMDGVSYYCNHCLHDDGSYDEGPGYFGYPAGCLFRSCLALSRDEIQKLYGSTYLKEASRWLVYGFLFNRTAKGELDVMRISYGDNPYGSKSLQSVDNVSAMTSYLFGDGVSKWMREKYNTRDDANSYILKKRTGSDSIVALSPEDAGLPLAKAFSNGDCYIRSSWDDNALVLSLKAGNDGKMCAYFHNRPELQSIALGAYGEYFIVTTGSASYRSALHYEYDLLTRSANTITIDGMNQRYPHKATYSKGKWDNRKYWAVGHPEARITKLETLPDGGTLLRSDTDSCYHIDMKEASRTIRFVPEKGFYIVTDRMIPVDSLEHTYDYRLHIFNRDEKTFIVGGGNKLKIQRIAADLYVTLSSNAKTKLYKNDGYMHGPTKRDYDPDGPNQGKPGSAIELDWQAVTNDFEVTAVLYPVPAGSKAPKIKITKTAVVVDGKSYEIPR